ncbi:Ig-like domain-containing protein [Clostridium sp.]|uniref:Ig-like domain-containing protein n=1 Tax=Clostridium sp. TaxID=1506 RepID=UPI0025BDD504|nr:Ig-like domain-containing protein [Clostridium sp.]
MNKKLFSKIIIISIITVSSTFVSCQNTSKKITISEDTKNEISSEENEINEAIKTGEKYLTENNFNEAKEYFNKALSLDKSNKDIYLKIKDIYLSFNRFDDAYFIIKTALTNNIDIENMKLILKDISSKFESINMNLSIYQDTSYTLPNEVKAVISGESISLPVTWDNQVVDSSTAGTFIYEGFNEDYGRKVNMEITVMENVYDKQIGSINNIYTIDGKTYIDVDLVELYEGLDESLTESKKDNMAAYDEEKGEYFLPFGYYIRNNNSTITTYEVSKDCIFQLYFIDLFALGYDSESKLPELNTVPYETFKNYIDMMNKMYLDNNQKLGEKITTHRTTLCWIESKNNNVYSISRKYL